MGRVVVASPGGRSVGGCKSILDGGYSGPSSHISLDMNLCLRPTCLPAARQAEACLFPSLLSFLVSFVLLPPRHLFPRHLLLSSSLAVSTSSHRRPSSFPSTRVQTRVLLLFPLRSRNATPLPTRGGGRLFSFFGIPILPSLPPARTRSSGVSLLAIREYPPIPNASLSACFVKPARLTENGGGGGGGGRSTRSSFGSFGRPS